MFATARIFVVSLALCGSLATASAEIVVQPDVGQVEPVAADMFGGDFLDENAVTHFRAFMSTETGPLDITDIAAWSVAPNIGSFVAPGEFLVSDEITTSTQ